MYKERFLYDTIPGRPSCHCGTIAELPSGEYMASWYAGTHEGHDDVAILTAHLRSEVGGWTDVGEVINTPGKSDGNMVLHVDAYGHVWMFYTVQQRPGWDYVLLYAMKSEDEGRTWDEPRLLSETEGWMVRNKAIRLKSGRTVLPCYDEITWKGFCLVSDDECVTWQQSGWMAGDCDNIQPTLLERSDGSILALMRSGPPDDKPDWKRIWRSVSEDGGMTWSPVEATELPNPNAGCDLAALGSGNAVLLFNDTPNGRSPLTVALSEDEGETWPIRRNLETAEGEFSYPAVIQGHGGRIHGLYTWQRTHMKHVVFDEKWVRAGDGEG